MNIMNAMVLSCVKATELIEMKEHVPLGLVKTMQLHVHTAMCSGCRYYMKKSQLINELLQIKFELSIFSKIQTTLIIADCKWYRN